jgi:hypothetical protein
MPCKIIRDNEDTMSVLDTAISGDRDVIKKGTEEVSKYLHLAMVIKYT